MKDAAVADTANGAIAIASASGSNALVLDTKKAADDASFTVHGAGVSGGIAIGHAHLISSAQLEVAHYEIATADIPSELQRFDLALNQVRQELEALKASVPVSAPAEMVAFLGLHQMILEDQQLTGAARLVIQNRRCNAEWALVQQMDSLVAQFDAIEDAYLRERRQDIMQVAERVLKAMMTGRNTPPAPTHEEDIIVVAHDLSPADMILFKKHQFAGFVTDLGGVTSHTAIVARSLGIPAIVGLHHARNLIREGELLIVDGREGVLIVNPDAQVLSEYRLRARQLDIERQKLQRLRTTPAATLDGVQVELLANIELPGDVEEAASVGANGIGLFRSEFLFLNRRDLPGEDEQFEAYRSVAQAMAGKSVTIRTLDLGADKTVNGAQRGGPNPALGLRAIRFCLAEPAMFHLQLRAILRASAFGNIRLLVPMIAHVHEVDQTFAALDQAKASLDRDRIDYDRQLKIGGMIEVPAAALSLGWLLQKLQFISIGTNDLIQYTLAIDRTDDAVAHLYDPLHPAVLQLVADTIRTATRAGIPVSVCGEIAGDPALTRLLLGFGLREFSMHPAQLLAIKQQVLLTDAEQARRLADRVLKAADPEKSRQILSRILQPEH